MRVLLLAAVAAFALAGCDAVQNPFAPKAAKPAAAPAPAPAPQAVAAPPAAPTAEAAAQPAAQAAATPDAVTVVRWSRADYAKREARLSALIANAETRDTTGETQRRAAEGRAIRARCSTRACIEASYASEEAWMKQWESSGG